MNFRCMTYTLSPRFATWASPGSSKVRSRSPSKETEHQLAGFGGTTQITC
jgi:hypothetical protein